MRDAAGRGGGAAAGAPRRLTWVDQLALVPHAGAHGAAGGRAFPGADKNAAPGRAWSARRGPPQRYRYRRRRRGAGAGPGRPIPGARPAPRPPRCRCRPRTALLRPRGGGGCVEGWATPALAQRPRARKGPRQPPARLPRSGVEEGWRRKRSFGTETQQPGGGISHIKKKKKINTKQPQTQHKTKKTPPHNTHKWNK